MASENYPQYLNDIPYAGPTSNYLNKIDICLPRPLSTSRPNGLWIIFVHGGDWRDPSIDRKTFHKTQELLLNNPTVLSKTAAFASLDYRLSPYPSHDSNPSSLSDPVRNVQHPTHIQDVLAAVQHLQKEYNFQDGYILVGHSTGGSLVYQAAMGNWGLPHSVIPPLAILGVSGIYDIPLFLTDHPDQESVIKNAFGSDTSVWESASPALNVGAKGWRDPQLTMLAQSKDDTEVDEGQGQAMLQALEDHPADCGEGGWQRKDHLMILRGQHNELWEKGTELARAIEEAVGIVSGWV
ncbi:hypothetical protein MMC08_007269 [Hypocenomyce scalaris]|nr:hypothetical protein [Hypocenomyce scalaris]